MAEATPKTSPAASPSLAEDFYKHELAQETRTHKRRILLLVLVIIGFIVFFALLYQSWSPLINSNTTSYGFEIALTAQYSFMNTAVWNTGWDKTGEFLATLYYNSTYGGSSNPLFVPGNNACGATCTNGSIPTSFDEWVGKKSDLAKTASGCTASTSCPIQMTIISMIKANASSDTTITSMFETAQNWSIINNKSSSNQKGNSSGALNDFFAYGLPIINTLLMGATLMLH